MPFGSIAPLFAQKSGNYKLISFNIRYNVASGEIGVGRNDGKKAGECMAVFFRTDISNHYPIKLEFEM